MRVSQHTALNMLWSRTPKQSSTKSPRMQDGATDRAWGEELVGWRLKLQQGNSEKQKKGRSRETQQSWTPEKAAFYSAEREPRQVTVDKLEGKVSKERSEKGKETERPACPSVNWSRLFHAVVGLWCRHICRLWKKILMELGQKPEKELEMFDESSKVPLRDLHFSKDLRKLHKEP